MVELVLDVRAELGEGPIWDPGRQCLVFVDIMRGAVHTFDPRTGVDRVVEVQMPVGAVACTMRGDWLIAAGRGFYRLSPETGETRFWAGTLSLEREADRGALYRLDPDGSVRTMLEPVTTSNGIDWSPDGRLMYYVDTRTRRVDVFDWDRATGTIGGRRPFVDLHGEEGRPDGLVVDSAGGVWVALWRGSAVRRYDPGGRLDMAIDVPASLVTKCAFGGPKFMDLYITTAWRDLTADERQEQAFAGGVFRVSPGVAGQPTRRFAG
jgi:sugar lactone lactonase YvrE